MNEVDKMYRNSGIEKHKKIMLDIETGKDVLTLDSFYPEFTAEKQLELIKWLGELDMLEIMRTTREDKAWIINSEYGMSGNVYKHTSRMKSFEETLAGLINSLWQDLTDVDKAQIKNILESEVRE